jgi:tRNA A-37 threonylcarbamoyl transferase component Bud32
MLGKYRLLERIGSGSMGEVYRAEHVLLGRAAAVKVLRPELASDEQQVERFFAEARAVNMADHRNVVDVTDVTREPDGTAWFVMELLEGSDLASRMHEQRLSLSQALAIAQQLCAALDAVHKAGIVHHDIKPENVFIAQRDGQDVVKLVDFGIARLPENTREEDNTFNGVVVGSPPYMAPEQACGMVCDRRADLYAVGAVLFEMIAGRPLFERANMRALLEAVVFAPPPRVSAYADLPSSVSADIERLLARCLAKQPARRPATARALGAEIAAIRTRLEGGSGTALVRTAQLATDDGAEVAASELLARCRPVWHKPASWIGASALLLAGFTWAVPAQQLAPYLRALDPRATTPAVQAQVVAQPLPGNTQTATTVAAPGSQVPAAAQTVASATLPGVPGPAVTPAAEALAANDAADESAAQRARTNARRQRALERAAERDAQRETEPSYYDYARREPAPAPVPAAAQPVLTVTPVPEPPAEPAEPTAPSEPADVGSSDLLDPYATE